MNYKSAIKYKPKKKLVDLKFIFILLNVAKWRKSVQHIKGDLMNSYELKELRGGQIAVA